MRLIGVKTNRAAIGAQIKITVENRGARPRTIFRNVGSGGSFGANPMEQHIGLGPSARIAKLDDLVAGQQEPAELYAVDKNQFIEIKEFAKTLTKLERKSFQLGGATAGGATAPR